MLEVPQDGTYSRKGLLILISCTRRGLTPISLLPSHITQHFQDLWRWGKQIQWSKQLWKQHSAFIFSLRLLAILGKPIPVLALEIRAVMHVTCRTDVLTAIWVLSSSRRNLVKSVTKCGVYRSFKPAISRISSISHVVSYISNFHRLLQSVAQMHNIITTASKCFETDYLSQQSGISSCMNSCTASI